MQRTPAARDAAVRVVDSARHRRICEVVRDRGVREIRFEGVETLERSDAELIQFLEYRGLGPSLSVPLGALYHKSIDAADLQAIAEELGRPPSFSERRRRRIMAGAVAGIARSPGKAYKPGRHSPRKRF